MHSTKHSEENKLHLNMQQAVATVACKKKKKKEKLSFENIKILCTVILIKQSMFEIFVFF